MRAIPPEGPIIAIGAMVVLAGISWSSEMEYVPVGDAKNAPDNATGLGSVDYEFLIGKYEVTNDQYVEFLNAVAADHLFGLYDPLMSANFKGGIIRMGEPGSYSYAAKGHMGNKPVVFVNWFDAARFANWLHNSRPIGAQGPPTTEDGAYPLQGAAGVVTRSAAARVWLPSASEWYKAAFFDPRNGDPIYRPFAILSSFPVAATADEFGTVSNPGLATINYGGASNWNGSDSGNVTSVGTAGNQSHYGTYDQSGNVWELSDSVIDQGTDGLQARICGDSYLRLEIEPKAMHSIPPDYCDNIQGFRVAAIVATPSSFEGLALSKGKTSVTLTFGGSLQYSTDLRAWEDILPAPASPWSFSSESPLNLNGNIIQQPAPRIFFRSKKTR